LIQIDQDNQHMDTDESFYKSSFGEDVNSISSGTTTTVWITSLNPAVSDE